MTGPLPSAIRIEQADDLRPLDIVDRAVAGKTGRLSADSCHAALRSAPPSRR
jgi:hypothetical protein